MDVNSDESPNLLLPRPPCPCDPSCRRQQWTCCLVLLFLEQELQLCGTKLLKASSTKTSVHVVGVTDTRDSCSQQLQQSSWFRT